VPLSFEISRYSRMRLGRGNPCSASSVRTSTPVEKFFVLAVFFAAG
jgi:hypothetical protein